MDLLVAASVTTIPSLPTGGGLAACPTGATCTGQIIGSSSGSGLGFGTSSVGSSIGSSVGLASLAGALVEILAVLSMAALIGIVIIAVVANRAEPDPTGRRPQSVYFFVVSFITITTSIVGSAVILASVLWLTAGHASSAGHAIARLLLVGVLVFVVSVGLFVTHLRRGLGLAREAEANSNPSHRVGQSYVSVVAFVSILVLLVAGVLTVYLLFAIASPATFGSFGGRSVSVRILVESIYLALVAVLVLWTHGSLLTPRLGLFGRRSRPVDPPAPGAGEQVTTVPLT
jgi:hypothetical protein